jgi:surfeit locus 1 family protein
MRGRYDVGREVVLIGRTLGETDGSNLLTPLRLAEGTAVVVDRGWVPYSVQSPGSAEAAPPDGDVALTGVLLPAESSEVPAPGASPSVQVASIDIHRLQAQVPYRLAPVYLWLTDQSPRQAKALPRLVPLPALSEGPHLSYAIQWFTFATIGVIGYPMLLRREIRRRSPQREEGE